MVWQKVPKLGYLNNNAISFSGLKAPLGAARSYRPFRPSHLVFDGMTLPCAIVLRSRRDNQPRATIGVWGHLFLTKLFYSRKRASLVDFQFLLF
jgi:hypothetical protein